MELLSARDCGYCWGRSMIKVFSRPGWWRMAVVAYRDSRLLEQQLDWSLEDPLYL